MTNYAALWKELDEHCKHDDYAGWDPFDGLNSRLFQMTPLAKSRWCRLAWLQFFKRSPVNFRALCLVPKTHNAKALSLFVRSYLNKNDIKKASYLLEKMLSMRSPEKQWGAAAWGYPFDWQAKAFFVAKGVPNVICTSYAILALEAAHRAEIINGIDEYLIAAGDFVLEHLWRDNDQGKYIAYIPSADALVHNASLWGAYLCSRAYAVTQNDKYKEAGLAAIETSLNAQGENGHWRYGTMPHHQFIDSFHTGYNLEALHRSNEVFKQKNITKAIAKGLEYYLANFFDANGQAAYYHNTPYPLDPHSYAQAILTLRLLDTKNAQGDLIEKIANHAHTHLWDEKKHYFYYQKTRNYTNKIPYLRWTQAWMHLALSTFEEA